MGRSYIDKVNEVDQWLYNIRCAQADADKGWVALDYVNTFRKTIVLANYTDNIYSYNIRPGILYLPFIKDGISIKLTTCVYKHR